MDVTDVPHVIQPTAVDIGVAARQRITLQHFDTDDDPNIAITAPHNSDARISNSTEWPSDLVFDLAYGCAVLKQWGDPTFITTMRDRINRGRGRGGGRGGRGGSRGGGSRGGGRGRGGGGAKGRGGDPHRTALTRAERAAKREQARTVPPQDDYADVVFALWTHNATKRQRQAEAKEADRTRDEVQKWLDSPQNQV